MFSFLRKNQRLVFYTGWFLLGLMQATLTEVQDDESYYWVYSRYPDWGYFDHPPMIAWLVKAGYFIFPSPLGLRLFPLLLNLLLIYLLEKIIGNKNYRLFYAIVLSLLFVHVLGFLAIPDTPLLCFTALFFFRYKKYLSNSSLLNAAWLGLAGALLLYSKYHAVLIFVFVIISNPALLRNTRIYFAGMITFLLFLPHLWWQYQHNWISFRYHLFESNVGPYRMSNTLEYLAGQFLLPGPLLGLLLLPLALTYRAQSVFERSLKFTCAGIYLFFLLSSFRGKVELNWTSPALVPLVILSWYHLSQKPSLEKWVYRQLPVSLILLLFARIIMVSDVLPINSIQSRFHSWKTWPRQMQQITKGLPVVFSNSFQRASKYWFYTGVQSYSLNLYKGRKNNFNYWPLEDSLLGKPVYFLDTYDMYKYPDSIKTEMGWIGYRYDSSYASFAKIHIRLPQKEYSVKSGDHLELDCRFDIPGAYKNFILKNPQLRDTTIVGVFNNKGWIKDLYTPLKLSQAINSSLKLYLGIELPPGKYHFIFAIHQGKYFGTHNSEKVKLVVE